MLDGRLGRLWVTLGWRANSEANDQDRFGAGVELWLRIRTKEGVTPFLGGEVGR